MSLPTGTGDREQPLPTGTRPTPPVPIPRAPGFSPGNAGGTAGSGGHVRDSGDTRGQCHPRGAAPAAGTLKNPGCTFPEIWDPHSQGSPEPRLCPCHRHRDITHRVCPQGRGHQGPACPAHSHIGRKFQVFPKKATLVQGQSPEPPLDVSPWLAMSPGGGTRGMSLPRLSARRGFTPGLQKQRDFGRD